MNRREMNQDFKVLTRVRVMDAQVHLTECVLDLEDQPFLARERTTAGSDNDPGVHLPCTAPAPVAVLDWPESAGMQCF